MSHRRRRGFSKGKWSLAALAVLLGGFALWVGVRGVRPVATSETAPDAAPPATQPADPPVVLTTPTPGGGEQPAPPQPAPPPATPVVPPAELVAGAKKALDAGDLVAARALFNNALLTNQLAPSQASAVKGEITDLNRTILFSPKPFPSDPYQEQVAVAPGDLMSKIARRFNIPWELVSRVNDNLDPRRMRAGQKLKVIHGPFHAEVSKGRYTLDLYLGGLPDPAKEAAGVSHDASVLYVGTFPVGLGAEGSTPLGLWKVTPGGKLKNPTYYSARGEGVIAADDPKNPLGERWIALEGIAGDAVGRRSYGIHGTIDPTSIGKQASQGCIRLLNPDVELLYDLLTDGQSTVRVVP